MSRKVYMTVKARISIPIEVEYKGVVIVEEGVSMDKVAKAIVSGKIPDSMDVEDSELADFCVVDGETQKSVHEQIYDYLTSDDAKTPVLVSHEVTDSK